MVDISLPTGLVDPVETRAILKVKGQKFNSWKSISINRSIAQIAGSFSFTTSNRFAGENEKWGLTTGDECTVDIGTERIITGFIDDIEDGYDLNSHNISFSGRDKTADLVDCSYDVFEEADQAILSSLNNFISGSKAGKGEFNNQTFLQIIEKLCSPFNIEVELDSALLIDVSLLKPIPIYKVETGSKVYEEIATLCQQYAVLPITKGDGKLFLTRAGLVKANDILEVGVNIKANKLSQSDRDRYSVYYAEGPFTTTSYSKNLIAEGKLEDKGIKRIRPYIIFVGKQATNDTCQKRAAWEARIRAGASRKLETIVRRWTQSNDKVWPLNGLVPMRDNKIGINNEFLIAGIALNIDSTGGELTTMSLVPPDTFVLKERTPVSDKSITVWDQLKKLR